MTVIENRVTIRRPLFDVFKQASDFNNLQSWQSNTVDITVTSGEPVRPGTMVAMKRKFRGSTIFVNFDVLDFQRNKRIELNGVWGRFPFRRVIEFSSGGGETAIVDTVRVNIPWLMFWYRPIFAGALKRQLNQEWQELEAHLNR